jgi:signal transduction histidine kinase
MKNAAFPLPSAFQHPIPGRLDTVYMWFWHALSLGVPLWALGRALWDARAVWGWHQVVMVGIVSSQIMLYLKTFVLDSRRPPPWSWLIGHFVGGLGLWLLAWRLDPHFFVIAWIYIGQMLILLPPYVALPATALLLLTLWGFDMGWDVSRVSPHWVQHTVVPWTVMVVLFLEVHHMGKANRERARLIADLQAAQCALELARQRDAELAALRERERLARDLHDSLGHALAALSVQLEAVQRLYAVDPRRASELVDQMKALTRTSMEELRRSLEGLRTPGLGDRLLRQALQTLGLEVGQRTGAAVTCQVAEGIDALEPAVSETLWRVAQEALTNVEKHAEACHLQVCVERTPHEVILRVADDGRGLPFDAASHVGHYGLRGMRERVEGLGGTLTLHSNSPHGTTVEARLPIITASLSPFLVSDPDMASGHADLERREDNMGWTPLGSQSASS